MPPRTPSPRSTAVSAAAAPLNEAGRPVAIATCRARFSAITLLLSVSICATISASGGDDTAAIVAPPRGATCGAAGPRTAIP